MQVEANFPLVDKILQDWRQEIGEDYEGYRNHVYRVLIFCTAFRSFNEEEMEKLEIAGAFHDIGVWSDSTMAYLEPSVERANAYLNENGKSGWQEEIAQIIYYHHKIRPYKEKKYPLVEVFRKADLVDASGGLKKFGLPKGYIEQVRIEIPVKDFFKNGAKKMKFRDVGRLLFKVLKW